VQFQEVIHAKIACGLYFWVQSSIQPAPESKGADRGGAQASLLNNWNIDAIFLVFHQHGKSRSGALQNVVWQYHKA